MINKASDQSRMAGFDPTDDYSTETAINFIAVTMGDCLNGEIGQHGEDISHHP